MKYAFLKNFMPFFCWWNFYLKYRTKVIFVTYVDEIFFSKAKAQPGAHICWSKSALVSNDSSNNVKYIVATLYLSCSVTLNKYLICYSTIPMTHASYHICYNIITIAWYQTCYNIKTTTKNNLIPYKL